MTIYANILEVCHNMDCRCTFGISDNSDQQSGSEEEE